MTDIDREKLVKFLRMTESDQDGEALNAIRMANRMVKAAKLTWNDVLRARAETAAPSSTYGSPDYRTPPSRRGKPYGAAHRPPPRAEPKKIYDDNIGGILRELSDRKHDLSTVMFIANLTEFYEKNGYLTEPQYEHVVRLHDTKPGKTTWRF